MKKYIVLLCMVFIIITLIAYRSDFVQTEITEVKLKNDTQSACKEAVLLIDEEKYSEGYIVFKDSEVKKAVADSLNGKCDEFTIYIADDTNTFRKIEGNNVKTKSITFPYKVKNEGFAFEAPSIFVNAKIDKEFYNLLELKGKKREIERLSGYEMKGY